MMRESEVHKFSDGTLTRILEKLDHMVKDFILFKFNPGMENRIWSENDKRRSKEFIEVFPTVAAGSQRQVRTKNILAFKINKGMSMSVQKSQAQDSESQQDDDQRLHLADDLKEVKLHASRVKEQAQD
ncbi:hypothetical protein Tco_0200586 [Tanacetum coccineum]